MDLFVFKPASLSAHILNHAANDWTFIRENVFTVWKENDYKEMNMEKNYV